MGSRGGALVRALASHDDDDEDDDDDDSRTRRHMWVEFVVGSLLSPRGFSSGTPVFPSPKF